MQWKQSRIVRVDDCGYDMQYTSACCIFYSTCNSQNNMWCNVFFFCCSLLLCECQQTWEENRLFADAEEATLFLGALDTIFLFSYAVVSDTERVNVENIDFKSVAEITRPLKASVFTETCTKTDPKNVHYRAAQLIAFYLAVWCFCSLESVRNKTW